jgi:hypothetical protein
MFSSGMPAWLAPLVRPQALSRHSPRPFRASLAQIATLRTAKIMMSSVMMRAAARALPRLSLAQPTRAGLATIGNSRAMARTTTSRLGSVRAVVGSTVHRTIYTSQPAPFSTTTIESSANKIPLDPDGTNEAPRRG